MKNQNIEPGSPPNQKKPESLTTAPPEMAGEGEPNEIDIVTIKDKKDAVVVSDEQYLADARQAIESACVAPVSKTLLNPPQRIGQGADNIVLDIGNGQVLKIQTNINEFTAPWIAQSAEQFTTLKKYLGPYLPKTTYHDSLGGDGVPDELRGQPGILQEKINGTFLDDITDADLNDPAFLVQLIDCMERVLKLYKEEREYVDWLGSAPHGRKHSAFDPISSQNIMVSEKEGAKNMYLVDTNMMPHSTVVVTNQNGTKKIRFGMLKALASLPWYILHGKLSQYAQFVKITAKMQIHKAMYKLNFETLFKWKLNKLKRRLKSTLRNAK